MEYKIYEGATIKIKNGFIKGSFKFMYCGMTNEKVFSLAPLKAIGYQGFSPNIYYNINSAIVQVYDRTFDVLEV